MTCCLVSDRQYGCCPLENAVCCQDHLHCCPQGNTCDTAQGRCRSDNTGENSRWYRKRPAVQVQHAEEESNEGVESETVVIKKTRQHKPRLPWVNNRKKPQQVQEITCADQRSKCPDHTTCCEMDKGVYGCCPVEDAVCCEDHLHCCPHGTTCDTAEGKCTNSQNGVETPWYKKFPSTQVHRKSAIELKEALIECENGDKCKSAGTW
uniref:Granulins domain-containing protein n=1 Tax=Acrobeloides nanus TaxID=290746 RepID=A0A914E253_9BILA